MIYLHIGRHKTGTTAIQRFLHANRDLLAQQNFLYPEPQAHRDAHHDVVFALEHRRTGQAPAAPSDEIGLADLTLFLRTLRSRPNAIVSSEAFQNLDPQWIVDVFPPGDTIVIVYIREQLDYLLSSYAQVIQADVTTQSFEDFARSWRADYGHFLDRWAAVFGFDYLRPRLYDKTLFQSGDVVRDFLEVAGVAWRDDFAAIEGNPNVSLSYVLILAKRLLNRLITDDQQRAWHLYGMFGRLAALDQSEQKCVPVEPNFAVFVRDDHRVSNAYVSRKYFRSDRDVFPYRDFTANEPFTGADVRQMLSGLERLAPDAFRLLKEGVESDKFVRELPDDERRLAADLRHQLAGLASGLK